MSEEDDDDPEAKQIRETVERLGHEQATAFIELLKAHPKFLGTMDGQEILISAFALGELCGMLNTVAYERLKLIEMPPDLMKESMRHAFERGVKSIVFRSAKVNDTYRGTNRLN